MTPSRPSTFSKCCAVALSASLVLQPLVAYAAPITASALAEVPLQGLNPVKPNIMFTLDDSGSMTWDYLPDWVVWNTSGLAYCRDNRPCGGQTGINIGSAPYPSIYTPYRQIDPPLRSSDFNRAYYNPTASYNPGKTADGTDLPCEGNNTACTGPWTAVYMDAYIGYPGINTGGTINLAPTATTGCVVPATAALCVPITQPSDTGPWPGVPDTLWCWKSSGLTGDDYQTADGDGSVCRRNGRAYSKTTVAGVTTPAIAAGYNYPNVVGTTCAASETCQFATPVTAFGYPYYYTIAGVWFCSGQSGGWGTTGCGTRQDFSSAQYVRYSASMNGGTPGFDAAAFKRVDIVPSSVSGSGFLVNGSPAPNPSGTGRTYSQEMASFAKWYAFHRTRILAMKTAGGIAFSPLSDEDSRVGFHTFWENPSLFLNVTPFNAANKATWFRNFYAVSPLNGTPSPDAVWRIGEYFANSGSSGLPGAVDPLDPVTGKCQPNYHLFSTDGYWNIPLGTGGVGDQDKTVPGTLPGPIPGFAPGSPFPRPYYEGPTVTNDNLADLAMRYWINDLRPGLPDNVKDSIAPWQHVTMYGLSIGAQGNIVYPTGIDAILTGTADWPVATGLGGPEGIDDLWHAALNSRGKFFNAQNPQQLAESIVNALADFTDQSGTGAAVGIAGAQFSATKSFGYRTSYEPGWWGDVKKYALDPNTGALPIDSAGNPVNPPLWSAATALDTQVAATGWDTNRRILTINDATNTVVPFHLASQLSPAQQASLVAGWSSVSPAPSAQSVLNYLRGDASNEGVGTTNFRIRAHILGDIAYSGAVPVGAPSQPYTDAGNPGYTAFASAQQSRTPMLYVGANDGMLHALNDSTTTDAGKETWAYVPKVLFNGGDPNDTLHTPSSSFQIGSLTYRRGGIPLFAHRFFVNATPRIWDVDFANTNTNNPPQSGNDWRTLLVGGLGAGGRSIYALDVTTPVALTDSEATIASSGRVLWEFTDPNLGYVYDAPTLVKTLRYGWVALVVSGYNNTGGSKPGEGILYVLNPKDGTILKQLSTGVGSISDPSGLSTIRAFTPSRKNPYVLQAYGGDLKGNVWRFDLSDPDDSKWKVELIAKLTDGLNPQPITTGVRIEIDQNNNVDRYIFVGTGKLLGKDDIADATVGNTLYVIRDGTVTAPDPAPATPYSRADLNTVIGSVVSGFSGAPTGRGWYQDGADKSEKIGTDVFADVQTVVYAFSKPATDPCARPLSSTLYARDLLTGNSVLQSEGGSVVASVEIGAGIAGVALIQGQGGSTSSVSSGDVRAQVTTMAGQVFSFGVKLAAAANLKHRVSWRLLNRD